MGIRIHLSVLIESHPMNTNTTGFRCVSKIHASLFCGGSSLSTGRANRHQKQYNHVHPEARPPPSWSHVAAAGSSGRKRLMTCECLWLKTIISPTVMFTGCVTLHNQREFRDKTGALSVTSRRVTSRVK